LVESIFILLQYRDYVLELSTDMTAVKKEISDIKRIRAVVRKGYKVAEEALTATRRGAANEPKSVAIHLARYARGNSLEEIGREFRVATYSSVRSVI
jgi:chromosomal replication initiation ATPase DnaA